MKIEKLKIKNCKKGYAVLELLFYISLFAILAIAVINSLLVMTRTFRETAIQRNLGEGGAIMERISREIRFSNAVNSANPLLLATTDLEGDPKTVEFALSGSDIEFRENDSLVGNLNTPEVEVTNLVFTQIITSQSQAVKVELTVRSKNDSLYRQANFYDTVVLRGSY